MYKIFDSPKEQNDIVNKEYVDKLFQRTTILNKSMEVLTDDWAFDEDGYYFILNHNVNSINLLLSFYNINNENIFVYYKILDNNNIIIFSNEKVYTRIIINYSSESNLIPDEVINSITKLQEELLKLQVKVEYLEKSIIKIEKISIVGQDKIFI